MVKSKSYWLKYSKVKRGKQREIVLKELDIEPPVTCEELRKKINRKIKENKIEKKEELSLREISRQMRFLEEEGLVKCLDRTAPYCVPYQLTRLGRCIKEELEKS